MEEKRAEKSLPLKTGSPSTAGERAAHMILALMGWVKDLLGSFWVARPTALVIHHRGRALVSAGSVRFGRILLVEDNVQTARSIIDTLEQFYTFGDVTIYFATSFQSALDFFVQEDIQMVIMDSDLHDEQGDGFVLTERFIVQEPAVIILANSSSRKANMKMAAGGASATIGKSTEKLWSWLLTNDRAGTDG